jgi:hypothetical protein
MQCETGRVCTCVLADFIPPIDVDSLGLNTWRQLGIAIISLKAAVFSKASVMKSDRLNKKGYLFHDAVRSAEL